MGTCQRGYSREPFRRDADDGQGSAVDDQCAVQDAGVSTEARAPEVVAENDHRVRARNTIVLRTQQATKCRRDTERGEVLPGDEHAVGFSAPTLVRDICTEARVRGQLESVVFECFQIAEQRVTEDRIHATAEIARRAGAGLRTGRRHQHDLVWRRHRQPAQDQSVEQGEDGGVDANAQRERQHRDACDQRPSYEGANGVAEILKH
jgi:hypothetical protein